MISRQHIKADYYKIIIESALCALFIERVHNTKIIQIECLNKMANIIRQI